MVKFDNTIKLDHMITLVGVIFSLGVLYNMMMTGLAAKADKSDVAVHTARLQQHDRDIDLIRIQTAENMSRIEAHLLRIENKIDKKADK